jgi:uroporphyrinogen decarboxylase
MFTKGGGIWLNDMAQIGADVIAIDWTMRLSRARQQLLDINKPLALQGNLDPLILFSEPKQIAVSAESLLNDLAQATALKPGLHSLDGHIFNLGHGINQFTPPENVTALSETVITKSKSLRTKQ